MTVNIVVPVKFQVLFKAAVPDKLPVKFPLLIKFTVTVKIPN